MTAKAIPSGISVGRWLPPIAALAALSALVTGCESPPVVTRTTVTEHTSTQQLLPAPTPTTTTTTTKTEQLYP